jgi:hypothetical protein
MAGYVALGTAGIPRVAAPYYRLQGPIGAKRFMEPERFVAPSVAPDKPALGAIRPCDGKPASVGNGVMAALAVDSHDKVDALHARALELVGKNEGAAGPRFDGFYAACFRDPDDHQRNVFGMSRTQSRRPHTFFRPGLPRRRPANIMSDIRTPGGATEWKP